MQADKTKNVTEIQLITNYNNGTAEALTEHNVETAKVFKKYLLKTTPRCGM